MSDQQNIFDEKLLNKRKKRVKKHFSSFFLHALALNDLKERLFEMKNEFSEILVVGHFSEYWAEKIVKKKISYVGVEKSLKIKPETQDLIISAFHLHSENDPISKLVQMKFGLKKNGIFMGYAFGERSLYELRRSFEHAEIKNFGGVSPRINPMIDTATYGMLLNRSGFNFCVTDKLHFEIEYNNPWNLINDLKRMGETNCMLNRSKRILTKNFLKDVLGFYEKNFFSKKSNKKYVATFDIICLTGWNSKPEYSI